jgi:hypothetical protein
MLLLGTIFEGIYFIELTDHSVLKKANRDLSTIETFALEFAPPVDEDKLVQSTNDLTVNPTPTGLSQSTASEVSTVSIHAMDVLAEIYADKNPKLARFYLHELAEKYDTMRKGYWNFRMEKVGQVVH